MPLWLLILLASLLLLSLVFVYLRERNKSEVDTRAAEQLQSLVRNLKEVTSSLDQSASIIKSATSSSTSENGEDDDPRVSNR